MNTVDIYVGQSFSNTNNDISKLYLILPFIIYSYLFPQIENTSNLGSPAVVYHSWTRQQLCPVHRNGYGGVEMYVTAPTELSQLWYLSVDLPQKRRQIVHVLNKKTSAK